MLIQILAVYAVLCYSFALAVVAFGITNFGSEMRWTRRIVARVALVTLFAPISVPAISIYIYVVSKITFKQSGK